jgi:hypothetical protein
MAELSVKKIEPKRSGFARRESSHARLSARKIGLDIPKTEPSLPGTEQEESDIA